MGLSGMPSYGSGIHPCCGWIVALDGTGERSRDMDIKTLFSDQQTTKIKMNESTTMCGYMPIYVGLMGVLALTLANSGAHQHHFFGDIHGD